MTEPISVRDSDGSQWVRQTDGTYRLRLGAGKHRWSDQYQGYTLQQITDEFGPILSKMFDDNGTDRDYKYLRIR